MFVRPKVLDVLPQMLWDIREELCSESLKFFFLKKGGARSWSRFPPEALPEGSESVYSSPGSYSAVAQS